MQSGTHPQPFLCGYLYETPSFNPDNAKALTILPYDLTRLYQEKDILSKGLADCVTYLKALREKQAKNSRQLNTAPSVPKTKKKKLQQVKRHLGNEIRNRERDERAWLNNLRACETNIYLSNIKAYHLTHASLQSSESTPVSALNTPTLCSHSGSSATDLTWNSWTDEPAVSSCRKTESDPLIADSVAPDGYAKDLRRDSAVAKDVKRPPPLSRYAEELPNSLPVPPNTAQSQFRHSSILSPAAPIFKPTSISIKPHGDLGSERLSISMSTAMNSIGLVQKRRYSATEISPILQCFSIDMRSSARHLPGQTWCNTTPQLSPRKDGAVQMRRQRTNSL